MVSIDYTLPAPPAIAWEYLTSPARRLRWQAGVTDIVEQAASGRRGVGTTNHCVHGKDAVVEEILDWRPSDYFTLNWQMPIPGSPKVKTTYELTETDDGTAVAMRMERPRSTKDRAFLEGMLPGLAPDLRGRHRRADPARGRGDGPAGRRIGRDARTRPARIRRAVPRRCLSNSAAVRSS